MNTAWSKPTKYIFGVSLALLGIYVLYLSRPVIPLLIVSALIAVVVRPLILWLNLRARLPRGLAVAIVYLLVLIIAPVLVLLAIPAIIDAVSYVIRLDYQTILQGIMDWLLSALKSLKAAQLPVAALDAYIDRMVDALFANLQQVTPAVAPEPPPLETILRSIGTALTATFGAAASLVGALFSQIATVIFMFLVSIYISLSAHTYRGSLLRNVPAAYQPEIAILLARIERLWTAFFRGELMLMLVIGVICWIGLSVLGVPGALYLGIIAGLLEIIPSLGPVIATVPAIIVALLQGSTYLPVSPLVLAGLVILLYVLVQQLENNLVVPRILGDAVELPPLIVIIGVLVGTSVAGILGALLATPVIASTREILRYIYRKMLGEDAFLVGETALNPAIRPPADPLGSARAWLQRLARTRLPARRRVRSEIPANPGAQDELQEK